MLTPFDLMEFAGYWVVLCTLAAAAAWYCDRPERAR